MFSVLILTGYIYLYYFLTFNKGLVIMNQAKKSEYFHKVNQNLTVLWLQSSKVCQAHPAAELPLAFPQKSSYKLFLRNYISKILDHVALTSWVLQLENFCSCKNNICIRQVYVLCQRKNILHHFIFTAADSKTKTTYVFPIHIYKHRHTSKPVQVVS